MRLPGRLGLAVTAIVLVLLWFAGPAWAHVTVDPSSAPKGAEITLGFRVPNEEATASTIKIQIFFPAAHPVLGVDPQSVPGWSDQIHTVPLNPPVQTDDGPLTEYVSEVDWFGGAIKPGHFQEFYVLAQQLPTDTNQVVFKALQTYSDGNVVRWIETTPPGGPEPAHPAPVLTLTATGTDAATSAPAGGSTSSSSNTTAIIAVILGAAGVLLGGASLGLVLRQR